MLPKVTSDTVIYRLEIGKVLAPLPDKLIPKYLRYNTYIYIVPCKVLSIFSSDSYSNIESRRAT